MIPVLSKLMGKAKKLAAPRPDVTQPGYNPKIHAAKAEPLVVVVVSTRELAIQVFDEARRMCYRSMLRPCVAYGGLPMGVCRDELGKGCDILIATPGRLCDLMDKPHILTMSRVKYEPCISICITSAESATGTLSSMRQMSYSTRSGKKSCARSWAEAVSCFVARSLPHSEAATKTYTDTNEDADHVFMMFSATFPKAAREIARQYLAQDYYRVRIGRAGSSHENIRQNIIYVDQDRKRDAIFDLLFESEPARTLIFCNSIPQVDLLDDFLYNRGLPTTSIHSGRHQVEREDAMLVSILRGSST